MAASSAEWGIRARYLWTALVHAPCPTVPQGTRTGARAATRTAWWTDIDSVYAACWHVLLTYLLIDSVSDPSPVVHRRAVTANADPSASGQTVPAGPTRPERARYRIDVFFVSDAQNCN